MASLLKVNTHVPGWPQEGPLGMLTRGLHSLGICECNLYVDRGGLCAQHTAHSACAPSMHAVPSTLPARRPRAASSRASKQPWQTRKLVAAAARSRRQHRRSNQSTRSRPGRQGRYLPRLATGAGRAAVAAQLQGLRESAGAALGWWLRDQDLELVGELPVAQWELTKQQLKMGFGKDGNLDL